MAGEKQYKRLENFRISREAWCILGIVLLVSLPLLTNYCTGGKELAFHLKRIENLKSLLRSGNFAVREGSPFLMIPAGLGMLGMSVQTAYKSYLFLINVITAWIGYLCFGRMFQDKTAGILGSMLYTWAPCRFDLLYCRAALGEIAAFSFFPVVLYGIYRIYMEDTAAKQYKYVWVLPALGFTCIVQANILYFLLAAGFTLLVCILRPKETADKHRFFALCKMVLGFVVVNSGYLFPVLRSLMHEQESLWRNVGFIQEKGLCLAHYLWIFFRYGQAEAFSESGMVGTEPLGVGFAVTVCVITLLWLLFTGRRGDRKRDSLWNFGWTLAVTGMMLMLMSLNCFPWDFLRTAREVFLRFITLLQSPAKLMVLVILVFVFLSCLTIGTIKKNFPDMWRYYVAAVIVTAFVTTQFLVGDIVSSNGRLDIITAEDIPEAAAEGSEYLP